MVSPVTSDGRPLPEGRGVRTHRRHRRGFVRGRLHPDHAPGPSGHQMIERSHHGYIRKWLRERGLIHNDYLREGSDAVN